MQTLDDQRSTPFKLIVAQTDGGMIPIMEPTLEAEDKRKGKKLFWREGKITLSYLLGSCTPFYAGSIEGGVGARRRLLACAVRAGFGADSRVHAVGDGAPWIAAQVEERFGDQGAYLVDFFHLCEYLGESAKAIEPEENARNGWMEARKDEMKTGRQDAVLAALSARLEPGKVPNDEAPVRARDRYITERPGQFDYAVALAARLAISSGKIESAQRYVAQKRLKLPGAWWLVANADRMLALRIMRLNGDGGNYWKAAMAAPPKPANSNGSKSVQKNAA